MKAIAIVGSTETHQFARTLADRLATHGTVGRVRRDETTAREPESRAIELPEGDGHRRICLSGDGHWTESGRAATLDDLLDRLAPTCDYALVEGYDEVDLPTVHVGPDGDGGEKRLTTVTSADDVDQVVEALATIEPYETLESLVARVKASSDETYSGAIATFTGRVRARENEDDEYTEYLEFERYDGVAEEKMQTIREELESRDGIYEVRLHHKTGVVQAGEDIVFVVVLAGHRTEAFRTVEDGINRLKEEVPLFKKEVTVSDEFWAHTGQTGDSRSRTDYTGRRKP